MVVDVILEASTAFAAYYLVAVGHGLFEKSGVLNLAIDGVFVLGVAVAYAGGVYGNSPWTAMLLAVLVALIFGLMIAYITTKFPISHGAVGLSTMFLGYGIASMVGIAARHTYNALKAKGVEIEFSLPPDPLVRVALYVIPIAIGVLIHFMLKYTKLGAAIRAAGEDPHAAAALGVDVLKVRLIAGAIGYVLIGLGAAMYVVAWLPLWSEGHGLGHGWIAFAISLAAGRHPIAIIGTSAVFAGLVKYQFVLQAVFRLSPEIAKMIPFVAAIAAMVIFMVTPLHRRLAPPKALGKIYFKEERTV